MIVCCLVRVLQQNTPRHCSVTCHVSRVTPAPLLSNLLIRHRHSALCTAVQPHFYTVQCPRVTKQHFYAGQCPSVTKHPSPENVHFKPPSVTAALHTCDTDSGDRRYITRETMSPPAQPQYFIQIILHYISSRKCSVWGCNIMNVKLC